jgi:hypothetical protein
MAMKDRILLLVVGLVSAGLAWAFFHFLGLNAFVLMQIVVVVSLILDNRQLRKEIRRLKDVAEESRKPASVE